MDGTTTKNVPVLCPTCRRPATIGRNAGVEESPEVAEALPMVDEPPTVVEVSKPPVVHQAHNANEAEFFSLVAAAHEFKTPLAVMLGYTDLLRTGHLGALNEKQQGVLGEIQESARRLQKLIKELLLLCELRSNGHAVKGELYVAEVEENLNEIFTYWSAAAKQKSITYELQLAAGSSQVNIHPLKLQHIVSNLIENALKFTPEHGHVVVSSAPCFWDRRKAQSPFLFNMERKANSKIQNAVWISVSDTGPGIPPEHHEDIFRDFVQLPDASSKGTGLGLAIARRLTVAHNGLIWVESEPGKGSKFCLLFSKTGKGREVEDERAKHIARR